MTGYPQLAEFLLAIMIIVGAAGRAQSQTTISVPASELDDPGRLLVCADVPIPPYIMLDANSAPSGIDFDIASEVGKRLGLKVAVVNTEFDTIIAALRARKCDVIMGAMNITPARQKVILQIPYAEDGQSFAVKKNNPSHIETKLDLCGKKVATETSTIGTDTILGTGPAAGRGLDQACSAAGKPDVQMQQYAKGPDVLLAVASGQADASLVDTSITTLFMREHPADLEFSRIGEQSLTPQGIGVTFDRPGLANAIEVALAAIVADGTYDRVFRQYAYQQGEWRGSFRRQTTPAGLGGFDFQWRIFLSAVFRPDRQILTGVFLTVSISIAATIIGIIFGTVLAFGRLSNRKVLNVASGTYVFVFRGTPLLVQMMIVFFGLGVAGIYTWPDINLIWLVIPGNVQAGILAFGLNDAAYMSEVIRAGILSLDPGQREAAKSLGMTNGLAMRRIILPQAARMIIPVAGNNFNSMLKTTSLLVALSVPELYVVFSYKNGSGPWAFRPFELFLAAACWYLALTTCWGFVQARLEAHFGKGYSGVARTGVLRRMFTGSRDNIASDVPLTADAR